MLSRSIVDLCSSIWDDILLVWPQEPQEIRYVLAGGFNPSLKKVNSGFQWIIIQKRGLQHKSCNAINQYIRLYIIDMLADTAGDIQNKFDIVKK